jgi:hypothetical protein
MHNRDSANAFPMFREYPGSSRARIGRSLSIVGLPRLPQWPFQWPFPRLADVHTAELTFLPVSPWVARTKRNNRLKLSVVVFDVPNHPQVGRLNDEAAD